MSTPDKPKRRGGNPAMVKGGPSINPHGRPRVGLSLANAVRERWPPDRIVELATTLAESHDDTVRLRALEFLAERGYGKVATTIEATLTPGYALDGERILARLSTDALRELLEASDSLQLDSGEAHALDAAAIDAPAPATIATQHQTIKPRATDDKDRSGPPRGHHFRDRPCATVRNHRPRPSMTATAGDRAIAAVRHAARAPGSTARPRPRRS